MQRQPHSCALEVLLARDASRGVILRRGPTKWVQLILWHTDSDTLLDNVSWADWDQRGRLVFAKGGQLFTSDSVEYPLEVKMIADFYTNTPTRVEPPRWATHWHRK